MGYISGKKLCALIITMIMIASGLAIMPLVTGDSQTINEINYIPHAPIEINSNADFASQGWPGNGTESDPWRIENLMIDGEGLDCCIYIGFTTDFFIIDNCKLLNTSGDWIFFLNSGIYMEEVQCGIIKNCIIDNNNKGIQSCGIFLSECDNIISTNNTIINNNFRGYYINLLSNVTIENCVVMDNHDAIKIQGAENCSIKNNIISHNEAYGIAFYMCANCEVTGNEISYNGYDIPYPGVTVDPGSSEIKCYHNNFIDNIDWFMLEYNQAEDEGGNYWDNGYPSGGNYWNDYSGVDLYSGPDQDIPGSDGIGDTPYIDIKGGTGAQDNYPLMIPWTQPDTAPEAYNLDATGPGLVGNHTDEYVTINATIEAGLMASSVIGAEFRVNGGAPYTMSAVDGTFDTVVEDVSGTFYFPNGFPEGPHSYEVRGQDDSGGWNSTWASSTFIIIDITTPQTAWLTTPPAPPTYCYITSAIPFSICYEDYTAYNTSIEKSYFEYRVNNGSWIQDAWTNQSFGWGSYANILTYTFPGSMFIDGDFVDYRGVVSDTAANGPYNSTLPAGSFWFPHVEANMNITKLGPSTANPGDPITYLINYTNLGTEFSWHNAENVVITDIYPAGVTFVSAIPAPTSGDNTWDIGLVLPGVGGSIEITVQISLAASGTMTNWAYLDYMDGNFNPQPTESDYVNTILPSTYTVPLHDGWNLISFPLIPLDTSVENLLNSISGNWDTAKYYDANDPADPWKTYRIGAATNDLAYIDNTMGFWLHVTNSTDDLIIYGTEPVTTNIILKAGWNLVSYPSNITDTVANALWGTGADRVECYDAGAPYLIKEMGPTDIMSPGKGYWVHVPTDSIWTVDY